MDTKVCLITGANSGIGKEAAALIAQLNYKVIMACRNPEKGRKALQEIKKRSGNDKVELKIVDMSLQASIKNLAFELQSEYERIDVIIHNAAIFDISQKKPSQTTEGVESIWATNHIGPVLFDSLIMNLLKKSDNGRIITISSKGLLAMPNLKIRFDDLEFLNRKFSVVKAYYQSKLAQMMYTLWLAEELKDTNITVNSIRVPAVQIDISKYPNLPGFMKKMYQFKSKFSLSPLEMAATYQYLATSEDLNGVTGKYFNEKNKEVKFTKYQKNQPVIKQLMELTMKYMK